MSADAKVWFDDGLWHGIHDGQCRHSCEQRTESTSLLTMLHIIERCGGYHYDWQFRMYPDPDNNIGLVGYCAGGSPYIGMFENLGGD